jgi:hypothetical protein
VLVACEYSGRVRDAFIRKGHTAVSVDLIPSDAGGPHYQGNLFDFLTMAPRWDMLIAFPPCTRLSVIGAGHWPKWQEDGSQQQAIDFFLDIACVNIPRIAIENPAGIMSTVYRKPDQYVHPWWFGEAWKKRTGLWLKNLPPLRPTEIVSAKSNHWVDGGSFRADRKGPGNEGSYVSGWDNAKRTHERAKTFLGIANAMADQWGTL